MSAIVEERSQSSDGERIDHGYVEERSFDSGEHRSSGHNSMNDGAKETLKRDRISDMPDSILLLILSFLPIKDTIKTGRLSQRWLYLWASVPTLRFTCTSWDLDRTLEFLTFVDKTLLSHRRCSVNKFIVTFHYHISFASHVDTWVRFATSANEEELCLALLCGYGFGDYPYVLPQYIYTNSLLTTLKLTWCDVAPNGLISWESLKSLLIGYTNLSEDVIQKILVGSPVLESLELYGCCGFNRLNIGSASLRKLVLRDHCGYKFNSEEDDDSALEISAPNLQLLGMLGKMYRKKFRLTNVQSLDICNLNFEQTTHDEDDDNDNDFEEQRNMVGELLDRLRHVQKLTMGNWCIKYEIDENFPENYWTWESGSSICSLLHLKTLKIVDFVARPHEFGLVIPLVLFLLEKGRTLEKIVINVRRGNPMECSREDLLQVAKKFLSYLPRISLPLVVMFSG